MKQFEVNGVRYIGVEVPEGDYIVKSIGSDIAGQERFGLYVVPSGRSMSVGDIGGNCCFFEVLPAGNYEIVELVKNLKLQDPPSGFSHYIACCFLYKEVKHNLTDNTLILKIKENE